MTINDSSLRDLHRVRTITILLNHDERLLCFLFKKYTDRLCATGEELRKDAQEFDHAERLLIRAALDIWNDSGGFCLRECFSVWDSESWVGFVRAIAYFKGFRQDAILALVKDEYEVFWD